MQVIILIFFDNKVIDEFSFRSFNCHAYNFLNNNILHIDKEYLFKAFFTFLGAFKTNLSN